MIDDHFLLAIERLRDELQDLRRILRKKYPNPNRQVVALELKRKAARLAEAWLVKLSPPIKNLPSVPSDYVADLSVYFQRILVFSERASKRSRYDEALKTILDQFTVGLVVPLKQLRNQPASETSSAEHMQQIPSRPSAFVGHSFAREEENVVKCVMQTLAEIGVRPVTGERPRADRISEKIKKLIDSQDLFVGLFTRRDKLAGKSEWTTSSWIIDEKAYAVGKGKKLLLLKEEGVGSIGGIQGDYEFIEFSRNRLEELVIGLLKMFDLPNQQLRS